MLRCTLDLIGVVQWLECAVDSELRYPSNQIKDYKIRICCFSAKHTERNKDWLTRIQHNVCERDDIFTSSDCCFSELDRTYKNTTKRVDLTQSGHHHNLTEYDIVENFLTC